MKVYNAVRQSVEPNISDHCAISCAISMLDHVILVDGDDRIFTSIRSLSRDADADIDGFIECIHRLGARCAREGKHQMMVMMMSTLLSYSPRRALREVAIQYGGSLIMDDGYYMYYARASGVRDVVRRGIENGECGQECLRFAVRSGDIETVRLLAGVHGIDKGRALVKVHQNDHTFVAMCLCARDFTVNYCQQLLELGIIQRGNHYHLKGFRSIPVIQWLLDHDMLDHNLLMQDCARNAAEYGGLYVDILHYLIDTLHLVIPKVLFSMMEASKRHDLSVFDYLLANGANVNELLDKDILNESHSDVPASFPLCLRYWLDSGMTVDSPLKQAHLNWSVLKACVNNELPVNVLDTCMEILSCDVNVTDPETHTTLLHCSARMIYGNNHDIDKRNAMILFKHLLELGANVNARDVMNHTPLHIACEYSVPQVISNLLEHGADINARDDDGQTPLMMAINRDSIEVVCVLLEYGANVRVPNNSGQTPLLVARACDDDHSYTIFRMLLMHGAGLNVNAVGNDNHTPFDLTMWKNC